MRRKTVNVLKFLLNQNKCGWYVKSTKHLHIIRVNTINDTQKKLQFIII